MPAACFNRLVSHPNPVFLGLDFTPHQDMQAMVSSEDPGRPVSKQIRLSLACNPCRKRKVRCDARQPKCRNCSLRGDDCNTSDLRKPGKGPGVRRRATAKQTPRRSITLDQAADHSPNAATEITVQSLPTQSPASGSSRPHVSPVETGALGSGRRALRSNRYEAPSSNSTRQDSPRSSDDIHEEMSWVARGYMFASKPLPDASVVLPDAVVHTDKTSHRFKVRSYFIKRPGSRGPCCPELTATGIIQIMGASSLQSLFCFVDLHLGEMGYPPSRPLFDQGMRHSVEFSLPLTPPAGLLHLSSPRECTDAVEAFFSTAWPLFPVVHRPAVRTNITRFSAMQTEEISGRPSGLEPSDIPALAGTYAILCIGCDEATGYPTDDSTRHLTLGYSLLPHLFAQPYLASVQALLLLALAFRGRCKDGQTFQLVAQAIRMAQSMGLHKHDADRPEEEDDLYQRVWWSCHALEKLNQLESGRPSICHAQEGTYTPRDRGHDAPGEHFSAWVSLSTIMGHISERLYMHKFVSSRDMLAEMAALDQGLLDWQRGLPDSIRPGSAGGLIPNEIHGAEADDTETPVPALWLSNQFYHVSPHRHHSPPFASSVSHVWPHPGPNVDPQSKPHVPTSPLRRRSQEAKSRSAQQPPSPQRFVRVCHCRPGDHLAVPPSRRSGHPILSPGHDPGPSCGGGPGHRHPPAAGEAAGAGRHGASAVCH